MGATAVILLAGIAVTPAATADPPAPSPASTSGPSSAPAYKSANKLANKDGVRDAGPDYNNGRKLPLVKGNARFKAPQRKSGATANAAEGDVKTWLAQDDVAGRIYAKNYTLRGLGNNIQVWVANDRAFPESDCRNALGLTDITDAQLNNFVTEFDTNIYPKKSKAFSVPPNRDGSKATLPATWGMPADYYQVEASQADDIVVLVDNVRDHNYSQPSSPNGQTYIAGFFYSVFNEYTDRNVMTIDAYDWLHRTGANPPDDTNTASYKQCTKSQQSTRPYGAPKPHLYEGTFAHEYQHLLEYYADPDETSWVNEGLADWAQSLVGYVDTNVCPDAAGAESHISCFQGWQPPNYGGPENSLTLWGDQGPPEFLCDYGAAYSFLTYSHSLYGEKLMTELHRNPANGLAGLDASYKKLGINAKAQDSLHKWAAMVAIDSAIDGKKGGKLTGGNASDYTSNGRDAVVGDN